jgi:hypothetical protein
MDALGSRPLGLDEIHRGCLPVVSPSGITHSAVELSYARFISVFESALSIPLGSASDFKDLITIFVVDLPASSTFLQRPHESTMIVLWIQS